MEANKSTGGASGARRTASDTYADVWALNYYLIKYELEAYVAYVEMLAEKPPLGLMLLEPIEADITSATLGV